MVAIPSNWGLLSYKQKNCANNVFLKSQSLLIEVFFPTSQLRGFPAPGQHVAIPSNWGLLSYLSNLNNIFSGEKSQSLLIEVFFPTELWRIFPNTSLSQSLLIEVFFPTCLQRKKTYCCFRSQSLLIEVFFPTNKWLLPYLQRAVAIPSNWGLLSYKQSVYRYC